MAIETAAAALYDALCLFTRSTISRIELILEEGGLKISSICSW